MDPPHLAILLWPVGGSEQLPAKVQGWSSSPVKQAGEAIGSTASGKE